MRSADLAESGTTGEMIELTWGCRPEERAERLVLGVAGPSRFALLGCAAGDPDVIDAPLMAHAGTEHGRTHARVPAESGPHQSMLLEYGVDRARGDSGGRDAADADHRATPEIGEERHMVLTALGQAEGRGART